MKQRWTNVPFTIVSLGGVKLGLQIKRQYCSELDQEKTYNSVKHVPRVLRHRKKRPGVDFFAKGDLAGLTNLHNQEHV
jgi:hypothetical protein